STRCWQLGIVLALVISLCVGNTTQAEDKKPAGGDGKIIIQIDASKLPPEVLKKLLEGAKVEEKKPGSKPEEKKPATKEETKKPNIVQVDLNKLPPDLAKRLAAELSKTNTAEKKSIKKEDDDDDDDDKGKKKREKEDDDDDKKGKG